MASKVKIIFLGDISLNSDYDGLYKKGIKPFSEIKGILSEADFVIGNLESYLGGDEGENALKSPRLKSSVESYSFLNDLNLGLVSTANNHVYDNLLSGYLNTVRFLDKNNIAYTGSGLTKESVEKPFICVLNDIRFAFINACSADTHPNIPDNAEVYINLLQTENILRQIKSVKETVDHVVLLFHWGGLSDYGKYPHVSQIRQSSEFITAGADLIVGHHSHTVQAKGRYRQKSVWYSLGNFCFSDIHFNGRVFPLRKSGKESVMVEITFEKNKYWERIIPLVNKDLCIVPEQKLARKFSRRNYCFKFFKVLPPYRYLYFKWLKYIEPLQYARYTSKKSFWGMIRSMDRKKLKSIFSFVKNLK
jgi:hypothetical protein